jgi:chemotaxis protein methyltransferase CheR
MGNIRMTTAFNNSSEQQLLLNFIQTRVALTLDEHRRMEVLRVAQDLIASGSINHPQRLIETLSNLPINHALWQTIIRVATISETYFYRDRNQLDALQFKVLPGLIEERRRAGWNHLRLWSAGCSTGEEPYTLAMILHDLIPDISAWDITILATDLNASNLERAENGHYRSWSFRDETPPNLRERWFTEEQDGYRVRPSLRKMVTFAQHNLASDTYVSFGSAMREMDVIMCRNVLIYFDRDTSAAVVARFHDTLRPNGWLILGATESAALANPDFKPLFLENALLYEKKATAEQTSVYEQAMLHSLTLQMPALPP